jgi:hypothetical protein
MYASESFVALIIYFNLYKWKNSCIIGNKRLNGNNLGDLFVIFLSTLDPRFQQRILMTEGIHFFVPGERINFELETNNLTTLKDVIETCVKLKRIGKF